MNKILTKCWSAIKGFWPWYKSLYAGRKWYTKTGIALVTFIVAFLLYLFMVDINFLWLFGRSPSLSSIRPKGSSMTILA